MTTIELSPSGQFKLPKEFCEKNNLKAGALLRVIEVGKALYVTPHEEPTVEEFEKLLAETRIFDREATPEEEKMVEEAISEYRRQKAAGK